MWLKQSLQTLGYKKVQKEVFLTEIGGCRGRGGGL